MNNKLMMIVILIAGIIAVSAVSASDLNASDEVVGYELAVDEIAMPDVICEDSGDIVGIFEEDCLNVKDDGTFVSLQNRIANASEGSTIKLENDYAYDDSFSIKGVEINKSLTIDGNGHSLNGLNMSRIFYVYAHNVVLENIKFVNGNASYSDYDDDEHYTSDFGGAVQWYGENATLVNCSFECNDASWNGGALYLRSNCVILENCIFKDNFARSAGGALYVKGNATIKNSKFSNNYAGYGGGAVFCTYSNLTLFNNSFIGNDANELGGAVYGSDLNASHCDFEDNSAYDGGGAVWMGENGVIESSAFKNNHANERGGAIYCDFVDYDYGGDFNNLYANVINSTFTGNYVEECGGAIYGGIARNCSFVNNYAAQFGGAMFESNAENCIFINNYADYGGGAFRSDAENCIFINNYAQFGGAMSKGLAVNCTFINNSAYIQGGAIDGCNADDCNFVNNSYLCGNLTKGNIVTKGNIINLESLYNYLPTVPISTIPSGGVIIDFTKPLVNDEYLAFLDIVGCDIQEDALNNYGGVELIGKELILKSLNSTNYTIGVVAFGNYYVPYSFEVNRLGGFYIEDYYVEEYETYDAHINLSDVPSGNHYIKIYLYGDYKVDFIKGIRYHRVVVANLPIFIKPDYAISAEDIAVYYGDEYAVRLTDYDDPVIKEYLQIAVNNEIFFAMTDDDGQVSFNLNLPPGEYEITSSYGNVSVTSKVIVKSTVEVSDVSCEYLNSEISARFLNTNGKPLVSKEVLFRIGDKKHSAVTNSNGVATLELDLDAGNHAVTAVNLVTNEEKDFDLKISKLNTMIDLTASQNQDGITLKVALTPNFVAGSVVFSLNNINYTANIKNGGATLTLNDLAVGSYIATAFYNGDDNIESSKSDSVSFTVESENQNENNSSSGSASVVNPAGGGDSGSSVVNDSNSSSGSGSGVVNDTYPDSSDSAIVPALTVMQSGSYYRSKALIIKLFDSISGIGLANQFITIRFSNGKTVLLTTDNDGIARYSVPFAPATYKATIAYDDVSSKVNIVIKKAKVKITASKKTYKVKLKTKKYTITLNANGNAVKKVKLTLKVNGKTYKAKTNSKGKATFKITKLIKKGTFKAVVKFAGNKYYGKTSKTVKIKVK